TEYSASITLSRGASAKAASTLPSSRNAEPSVEIASCKALVTPALSAGYSAALHSTSMASAAWNAAQVLLAITPTPAAQLDSIGRIFRTPGIFSAFEKSALTGFAQKRGLIFTVP